jgi:predicted signal transduction protein with EAL and GGDEF domain
LQDLQSGPDKAALFKSGRVRTGPGGRVELSVAPGAGLNINPGNIVIEINESKVRDFEALRQFCDTYRRLGFMVALDDVGTGFSNMDRIPRVKPDIIKICNTLVRNIQNDYYKQGVIRSLISMSNMIGALVIAEGVETKEETIEILRLGGHMMQGYFFAKPQQYFDEANSLSGDRIEMLSKCFHRTIKSRHRRGEEEKPAAGPDCQGLRP